MIKILPSGTTAIMTFGLKPSRSRTIRGRLGEGAREHEFISPEAGLKACWKDNGIEATLRSLSDGYIRRVSLVFKYRSPHHASETVIWTESADLDSRERSEILIDGTLTSRKQRRGSGALWISESPDAEGILFRQSPPAEYPISFEYRPGAKSITVTWTLERRFEAGETLVLPTLRMNRGEREKLIGTWRREWRAVSPRTPSVDRRIGWWDEGEVESPRDLREILSVLRAWKVSVDWFALGPGYAADTGDWLNPSEVFRDRMGSASRSIGEQNIIPALRFAPFLVSRKSAVANENRDWMVKNSGGAPLNVEPYGQDRDSAWVLDISRIEVQNHIRRILTVMRDQWGFRAFILERLDDLVVPGQRARENRGPGALFEIASKLIRETVGNKVYLCASGIPLQVSPGEWDARFVAPKPVRRNKRQSWKSDRSYLNIASRLLHWAPWSEGAWVNASGPLPLEMFRPGGNAAVCSLVDAAAISSGMTVLTGDPRKAEYESRDNLQNYLTLFSECRKGRLRLAENVGGGLFEPLVVRNETGWIGLFNFSSRKREIRLDRESLKTALGVASALSAGDGAVFNSPEIHVALHPRGHRLFRG